MKFSLLLFVPFSVDVVIVVALVDHRNKSLDPRGGNGGGVRNPRKLPYRRVMRGRSRRAWWRLVATGMLAYATNVWRQGSVALVARQVRLAAGAVLGDWGPRRKPCMYGSSICKAKRDGGFDIQT